MTWEEWIFWILAAALLHSYLFFPVLLRLLAAFRKETRPTTFAPLPTISILMAAYNEEKVLREKLHSVLQSDYPGERMQILVGSDASTDNTNNILEEFARQYPQLHYEVFPERSGKIRIINTLASRSNADILVITDANVLFEKDTLNALLQHYQNPEVGLVDSNMLHLGVRKEGISVQEQTYIQTEVGTKNAEGKLWGCMMGPFGGCYSIRRSLFSPVPEHFLVDDFYINMKVLEHGKKCINEKNARVYEDVPNDLLEEFRRKVRIATGNYQNLLKFFHMLFRFNAISFCFLSHKVLRWLGPWFMLILLFQNIYFLKYFCPCETLIYKYTLWVGICSLSLPLMDYLLKQMNIHLRILRYATHFYTMNLALFIGAFRFAGGVRSSVWQPTRRKQ